MRRSSLLLVLTLTTSVTLAAPPKKRIHLEFHRADLHTVLRVLAEAGRVNLVVADDVQGTVSLRLRDVAWDEALRVVLAAHGLGAERVGDILRVAPLRRLAEEAELRARVKEARTRAAPLRTTFIPVSHARAADLLPHVRALLSPRGTVSVDARTNVLIVTDEESFVPPGGP